VLTVPVAETIFSKNAFEDPFGLPFPESLTPSSKVNEFTGLLCDSLKARALPTHNSDACEVVDVVPVLLEDE
jgi:hypothetical protein